VLLNLDWQGEKNERTRISNVKIEIKPFFINNVSKINDNIILKVVGK
jgi:hypothetical protein